MKKDKERDKLPIMEVDQRAGKADVIYMIATHVIFESHDIYQKKLDIHFVYTCF